MAKNRVRREGRFISSAATDPVVPASGDPVVIGQIPGVALIDEEASGDVTFDTAGVWDLSVAAIDGGGNSAVVRGDVLYYVAADVPKLSKKVAGVRFGYALGPVGAGLTATIPVKVGY
jgi:predicted RecA/RadA family phage recombinase